MFTKAKPIASEVKIRPGDWPVDEPAIATVRRAVFIEEQGVPEVLEWEAIDPECDWFVAQAGATLVGTARLTRQGRIGRMAVLADWRGRGIGAGLLGMALARAQSLGLPQVELHAQCHALGFYQRFGFVAVGPEFSEADIPHRQMILDLRKG